MRSHPIIILIGFVVLAIVSSCLLSGTATGKSLASLAVRTDFRYQKPSADALFGTDQLGRSVASRLATAVGLSLRASLLAEGIALALAVLFGVLAGWNAGGFLDRTIDFLSSFLFILPGFLIVLVMSAVFDPGFETIYMIVGFMAWPPAARLVRAEVVVLCDARFITAERAAGLGATTIFWRSIIPLALLPPFLSLLYLLPEFLGLDLGLSLFGIGASDPSIPTLGRMVYSGLLEAKQAWWLALFPASAMIAICLLAYAVAESASLRFSTVRPVRD